MIQTLNQPTLLLVRGLPGSGKTTLARTIISNRKDAVHYEADQFFEDPVTKEYKYDKSKIHQAHETCFSNTRSAMELKIPLIVVANVFAQEWTVKKYFNLAQQYSYKISTIIVENRNGMKSVHDVPEDTISNMFKQFSVKL